MLVSPMVYRTLLGRTLLLCSVCLMVLTQGPAVQARKGRGSKWWTLAKAGEPNNLVDNSIRSGPFGSYVDPILSSLLTRRQRRLVRENPGSLTAIAKGVKVAIGECKHQFANRRWNCPTTDFMRGRSVFGKIVDRGCRETAFVYAITSAAVAHAVSRSCSEGLIESCSCDYGNRGQRSQQRGPDWEWGGCSDNIGFGHRFAREFVDSAERVRDFRYLMNLHNNEAGRMHVSTEMRKECKCHGMSGSCTVKTCWMRLPQFREVSDNLKDRFDGASRVLVSNSGNHRGYGSGKQRGAMPLKPYNPEHKPPTDRDLVYFEESPDFCKRDPKQGIQGTQGRQCNDTSLGVDGCDLMCCARGYNTEVKEVLERCNCTFHWCCEVKCKICKTKKTVHTCK